MKIEIDLFDSNKLPGVEVHTHINSTECTGTNQLTFPPPNRWRRWRRRLEADSGFTNGGADLVGESGEASIVGVCGWRWEDYGSANGAEEVLHCICLKKLCLGFGNAKDELKREKWSDSKWCYCFRMSSVTVTLFALFGYYQWRNKVFLEINK